DLHLRHVLVEGGAEPKSRERGMLSRLRVFPWPCLRRLACQGTLPCALLQHRNELGRAECRQSDESGRASDPPPEPHARAEEEEEELTRPPFRHQILLPVRRGEA